MAGLMPIEQVSETLAEIDLGGCIEAKELIWQRGIQRQDHGIHGHGGACSRIEYHDQPVVFQSDLGAVLRVRERRRPRRQDPRPDESEPHGSFTHVRLLWL